MCKTLQLILYLIIPSSLWGQDSTPYFDKVSEISGNIYCIHQDTKGYLWVGSKTGLTRYDGANFYHFDAQDSLLPLSNNYVQSITEDNQQRLWLGTRNGLNILNARRDKITYIESHHDGHTLSHPEVRKVVPAAEKGHYWIATYGGGVNYYDEKSGTFTYYEYDAHEPASLPGNNVNDLFLDRQKRLWVGCEVGGLARLDHDQQHFTRFKLGYSNENYTVSAITEDDAGTIWIGTMAHGLFRYDENKQRLTSVHQEGGHDNPKNAIRRIRPNKDGTLWLGTLDGLARYDPHTTDVHFYSYQAQKKGTLPGNAVWALYKDRESILWVGLLTKGLCKWDQKAHRFQTYHQDQTSPFALTEGAVNALYYSKSEKLWIASRDQGVYILDPGKGKYENNTALRPLNEKSISEFAEDNDGHLWMTGDFGVYRYTPETKELTILNKQLFKVKNHETGGIYTITRGNKGDLYIGGWGTGLVILAREKITNSKFTAADFQHLTTENTLLGTNVIWQAIFDGKYTIWFHTKSGVYAYDENTHHLKQITSKSLRLCINKEGNVWGIDPVGQLYRLYESEPPERIRNFGNARLEKAFIDDHNRMWLSTSVGLYLFQVDNPEQDLRFNHLDGLSEGVPFRNDALLKNGQVVLGTSNGLVFVKEKDLQRNTYVPHVLLDEVELFRHPVRPDFYVWDTPGTHPKLEFAHHENDLSFRFSPMAFSATTSSVIWYKLQSEQYWHQTSKNNPIAYYPQLASGKDQLLVKTSNTSGYTSDPQVLLSFIIHPPWWLSWWAIVAYILVALVLLRLAFTYSLISVKAKARLQIEQYKRDQQEELLHSRLRFFTNISHEIKTPLTLILGPVNKLLREQKDKQITEPLTTVRKNAEHLHQLFEELLEFRQIESGVSILHTERMEMVTLLQNLMAHYKELAALRAIDVTLDASQEAIYITADSNKLQKVIHNLLSNAFKHTPEQGTIKVTVAAAKEAGTVTITIADSGSGISDSIKNTLFDRFVTGDEEQGGTGIGLALVKQIVALHKGTVEVENGHPGARFRVTLPIGEYGTTQPTSPEQPVSVESDASNAEHTILLVEDNEEIRGFVKSLFESNYDVLEARNGVEALELMGKYGIELIISDVMMPGMDGMELCRLIKSSIQWSHIPVILVTARSSEMDRLQGLEYKADDYITKPFQSEVLQLKVRNILEARQRWKQQFLWSNGTNIDSAAIESLDEKFLQQVLEFIHTHLSDTELNVSHLSKEIGMHRSNFSKKMKALTGLSPVDFIRHIRLKKAYEYLMTGKLNVSEVAYEVGYNDPRYFSTSFKEQFKVSPSELLKNNT